MKVHFILVAIKFYKFVVKNAIIVGKIIRLVRVMRIMRIFKLVRHFAGLQSLIYTLNQAIMINLTV